MKPPKIPILKSFYVGLGIACILLLGTTQNLVSEENTSSIRRLLRVWPSHRPEECDWAIRKFICLRCLKNGYLYAQEIHFLEDGRPYRIHGCYSEPSGFFPIPEGRDHSTKL